MYTAAMFSVVVHEKRILCARIESCDTVDEAKQIAVAVRDGLVSAGQRVIGTADFRRAKLFTPPVTEIFVGILKSDNPLIERSGHVLGSGATLALQLERIVREAQNPLRRTFRNAGEAEQWLGEVLTSSQRLWLHDWYRAGDP
jgi:hypothetical protein